MNGSDTLQKLICLIRRLMEGAAVDVANGIGNHPRSVFPGGWCQDSARVVGALLKDRGEVGFKLAFGTRGEHGEKSHVWLERDGLIVDITADQFKDEPTAPVMVTTDRSWHDLWQRRFEELEALDAARTEGALYYAIASHPDWSSEQEKLSY